MNVLLEVPTFDLCLEFGDDCKLILFTEMNLCTSSQCKWGERLLRCLHQTWEERKSGQARSKDAVVLGMGTTDIPEVVLTQWLLGWASPLLVPTQVHGDIGQGEAAGEVSSCPLLLLPILFSPHFSSFDTTPIPAGRHSHPCRKGWPGPRAVSRFAGAIPNPVWWHLPRLAPLVQPNLSTCREAETH